MLALLDGARGQVGYGYVEFFGYHAIAGGWLISGWLSHPWAAGDAPGDVMISFENGDLMGKTVATFFPRQELPDGALGLLLFIATPPTTLGPLHSISMTVNGVRTTLQPADAAPQLREPELVARIKSNLVLARPDLARDRLFNLMTRRPYTGEDTLDALSPNVSIYFDEAIRCGPSGLALVGWLLAKPGEIRELRVRSGARSTVLDMEAAIKVDRQDVLQEFVKYGFDDSACGFVVYLPDALEPEGKLYLEVETNRCEIAYRNISRPGRTGMSAIKQLLGLVDVRFADMRPAFDHVLGPAVQALNVARLATPPIPQVVEYGVMPKNPVFSVIVPLYGRMDFVEYQLALFSARPEYENVEFIYVLDDPSKRREAQILFTSIHERFRIPFRAVLLDRNLGFAPANNVGLRYAHGTFIAYLNSDVFPGSQDWLEQLSSRLIEDPKLGAIGPLLLFEDGSVQHRGMFFERLAEFGDWYFCQHLDKGLRHTGSASVERFLSITGACMVMRRELALQVGGFDETYVIGDFEDSDLCLKLIALGYECAVDPDVRLYHLERKSQSSAALTWRSNLTAYNAWQHDRRWSGIISEKQDATYARS
jgi:GT2 family glycosyltransferase